MSFARRLLGLMLALLFAGVIAQAQTPRSTDDPRNQAPTVNGGTGLFTVYDAQTLRKGEFNFGFFANHFHRDPGDVTFQKYPVNFQVGFSDHIEVFVNFEAQQVISVGSPALLSGFYLPDVRTKTLPVGRTVIVPGQNTASFTIGDPCGNGGFPGPCRAPNVGGLGGFASGPFVARPSGNDTAVYVGLGAPVGGILPALPPNSNPNYLPSAPFIARFSDNHTADVWIGGKIRFTGPKNPFGFALIPLVKIPTTRQLFTGLERGRGTGGFDYGVIAALDGRLHKYINLSTNIGFIKKGDPRAEDMNLGPLCAGCGVIQGFGRSERALDLPNELRSGIGVDFPLSQYLQAIFEINSTYYVSSRTPSLLTNNPVDLVAGVRVFPTRWISISAAYQRHLNWFSELDKRHSPNGFIAGVSIGHVNKREEPLLPNQPPTVALALGNITKGSNDLLRESASTVCAGDKVDLRAAASDPDGDALVYAWSSSGGRVVGDGANTVFDTTGLAPGDYTVTVEVNDGCGCVAFDSKTIRVTTCPPLTVCFGPNLDLNVSSTSVDAGERVNFSTSGVTGGRNYGNVTYQWTASAGNITGNGLSATLDTTGVTGGTTIEVTVRATSDAGNCSASGTARTSIKVPPPPPPPPARKPASVIDNCVTFKKNQARVDNACKDILSSKVIPALQADAGAKVVIDGYRGEKEKPEGLSLERAKNTRDRLADGQLLGTAIDTNRIVVRDGGVSTDGSQVRIWLVPSNGIDPEGPAPASVGDVTPEKKAPARRRRR
ncbi:MAG TPA: PKD domain-containing protein [Blastocatellia bacterium]|nr:PKD domain-containing protein [Blastocatellia bacterium]HMV86583.1 PKD domain-containing protein [Blastocatellia bacterium]HMX24345.1 PKD domain-containing protein [Blastocatellia bacterium]HMY73454.1 PKD domain-containing protein [Blastocatellia bacterium]HMZ16556.1 PKD domain-containing protein [Blastocatellia bacterium]